MISPPAGSGYTYEEFLGQREQAGVSVERAPPYQDPDEPDYSIHLAILVRNEEGTIRRYALTFYDPQHTVVFSVAQAVCAALGLDPGQFGVDRDWLTGTGDYADDDSSEDDPPESDEGAGWLDLDWRG